MAALNASENENEAENDFQRTNFHDMACYGAPKMDQLTNYIAAQIPGQWYEVGIQIKIPTGQLDGIKGNTSLAGNPRLMFCEVFKLWQGNPHQLAPFNWETILNALASCFVDQLKLADSIAAKIKSQKQGKELEDSLSKQDQIGFNDFEDSDISSSVSGFGYYTEDDLKKLCGCGSCSLEKIITHGCSQQDSMPRFPLLDVRRLPDCKRQQYIFLLEDEAFEINIAFASLLDDVSNSFSGRISVKNVVNFIKASRCIDTTIGQSVAPHLKQKLESCNDMCDVFSVIADMCSWFNHHPLESLVKRYGQEDDKKSYERFKEERLMKYLQRSVTEIPKDSLGLDTIEGSGAFRLKVDHPVSHKNIAGCQVLYLKGKIAKALDIPIHCLHLHSIREGCLELEYSLPIYFYVKLFFPLSVEHSIALANIVGTNDAPLQVKSIWYEGKYRDIPFKVSSENIVVKSSSVLDSSDLLNDHSNKQMIAYSNFIDELQNCLEEKQLTVQTLKNTICTRSILLSQCKHLDELDISAFWQSLPFKEKKIIKSKHFNQEERIKCIINCWFDLMGNNVTFFQIINMFSDCSILVSKILDTLKEILTNQVEVHVSQRSSNLQTEIFESTSYIVETTNNLSFFSTTQITLIQREFANFLLQLHLCIREDNVDEFALYILSRQRIYLLKADFYSKIRLQLQNMATKESIMDFVASHIDWFNISFLESFLKEFSVATIESYQKYLTIYNKFKNWTLTISFKVNSCEILSQFTVQLSHTTTGCELSIETIVSLKMLLSSCLGLSIDSIDFCSYDDNALVFSAPFAIVEEFHDRKTLLSFDGKELLINSLKVNLRIPCDLFMTEIDQMFASLVVHLFKSMKEQPFNNIKCFITEELVVQRIVRNTYAGFTPFFNYSDIINITNLKDLIFFLNNCWSFFNFTLLGKFIKRFGSQEAKDFLTKYSEYLQKSLLSQLPTHLHHSAYIEGFNSNILTVKVEPNFFSQTVGELLSIHDKVAQVLHVQKFALLLQRINREECHLEFRVPVDTCMELSPLSVTSFNESFVTSLHFQDSELPVIGDDDDDIYDGDSGVGATTDQSDTESIFTDLNEDQQPSSLESNTSTENERCSTPLVPQLEEVKDTHNNDNFLQEWPSFEKNESVPKPETDINNQPIVNSSFTKDKVLSQSSDVYNSSELSNKLIHVTPDPYKGVIQVCDMCLFENSSDESLLWKQCHLPDIHRNTLVYGAWDSKAQRIIRINPRPLAPIRDLFQLCDSVRCRGSSLCTFSHNKVECDAWNYDLIKERENFGLPVTKTSSSYTPHWSKALPSHNTAPYTGSGFNHVSHNFTSDSPHFHRSIPALNSFPYHSHTVHFVPHHMRQVHDMTSPVKLQTSNDPPSSYRASFFFQSASRPFLNAPLPLQNAPRPLQSAPHPLQNAPRPLQSSPCPLQNAPHPLQSAPHPLRNAPHPLQSAPRPLQNAPRPLRNAPHPLQSAPCPLQNAPRPLQNAPRAFLSAPLSLHDAALHLKNVQPLVRISNHSTISHNAVQINDPGTAICVNSLPSNKSLSSRCLFDADINEFPPLPSRNIRVTNYSINASDWPQSGCTVTFNNRTVTPSISIENPSRQRVPFIKREEWKLNFHKRLTNTVLQDEVIEPELSFNNYRDKFYYLLCFEESEHIKTLTEKCDGKYRIKCLGQLYCVLGMDDNQIQYAVQASEAVFFTDFKNDEKKDICKGIIHSINFRDVSEKFYVSMSEEDFSKIQTSSHSLGSGLYEVHMEFEVKHSYFNGLHQAVISIPDSMIRKITPSTGTELTYTTRYKRVNPHLPFSELCVDENEQYEALESILTSPADYPVVISGPFGSGKTRILARAAYEFAIEEHGIKGHQTRILICAHHINTIETYLSKYFEKVLSIRSDVKVVRIVRKGEHPLKAYSCSNIINRTIGVFKQEVSQHTTYPVLIIVSTYMTSLQVAKVLNKYRFTHILLDEAAQVREPEAIAALSLGNINTKVVIAGDSKQVGPSVLVLGAKSNEHGLGTSLLERLEQQYNKLLKGQSSPYLKYLNRNYRCHHDIVGFLSQVIYKYPINCAPHPKTPYPVRFPCVFYWSSSRDSRKAPKDIEADAVIRQVRYYFKNDEGKRNRCIISPFRTQLNIIKSRLPKQYANIMFLPSYTIQGHEFEAVILSTLEPLEADGTSSNPTKSLINPKIFNTAVSRCKSFVVAVGDPFVLLKAERQYPEHCWKHYLEVCLENETLFFPDDYHQRKKRELKQRLKRELK